MPDNFESLQNLRNNVLLGIRSEERVIAKQQLTVSTFIAVISTGAIVVSVKYAVIAFYQSSFYSYAALLLSDPDIVMRYWREFAFVLLESLPVVGIVCCLVALFTFLVSLRLFTRSQGFAFRLSFVN